MSRAAASTLLVLILTLPGPSISEAGLWFCTQPDGSSLYTDQPGSMGACKKYKPVSELVYRPPIIRGNLPPPPPMTDTRHAALDPVPQPDRSDEREGAISEAGFNAQRESLHGYPEYIEIYNYVPGAYGVPYGRLKHVTGFPNQRGRYDFQRGLPFWRYGVPPAPPAHVTQKSVQATVPATPPSLPGFTKEVGHR
jgi:hypothetical protein